MPGNTQPQFSNLEVIGWIEKLEAVLAELDTARLAVAAAHLSHSIELLKLERGSVSDGQ